MISEPTGNEAPALRSGLDNYDMYQYPDSSGLPIQDIFKTILLDHQLPKKYATHLDDTILDYEEDLLLDSPILDSPLLGSLLYDHPYYGSPIVDAGAIIKTPLIKNSLVKGSIIKRPVIKRPVLSPLVLNQYKKKQETLREIEILLKTLLPLIKSSSVPMKARLQIGRQGEELTK